MGPYEELGTLHLFAPPPEWLQRQSSSCPKALPLSHDRLQSVKYCVYRLKKQYCSGVLITISRNHKKYTTRENREICQWMTHSLADTIFTDKGMHLLKYFFSLSETLNDIRESSRISKKSAEQAKGRVPEKKTYFLWFFAKPGGQRG